MTIIMRRFLCILCIQSMNKDGSERSLQGYKSQIITLEYNEDGSVCIRNGYGQYLDIEGGNPVSGGTLTFKEKSGSSSQNFVFKY